jgi:hypothetical protein
MATFEVDVQGVTYEVDAPDENTAWQWANAEHAKAPSMPQQPKPERNMFENIANYAKDNTMGALRGAAGIGSTLLQPLDATGITGATNKDRRASIDQFFNENADTGSFGFGAGKIGAEVAGTAGVGGALAKPVAKFAPQLAAALESGGMVANGAGLPTRIAGGAIAGGAAAGLVNPESAGTGALIGGAIPGVATAAGNVGQKIGSALRPSISPEVQNLAIKAQEKGIDIPLDRLTDNKFMNSIANALNYVPGAGRAGTEARMNTQLNQALSKTFGQDSSNVTMALRKASNELGSKFDDVLKNNTLNVDDQLMSELIDIQSTASKELGADGLKAIDNQVEEILAKSVNGKVDGQAAYNIKRTLDRIGRRNTPEAYHAIELKRSIMDALNRSIGPEKAAEFATVRKQYGNMLSLEKLAKNGAEGEISAARLANMNNINNPELQEMADIAAQFIKPREGAHSGAQRAFAGMGLTAMGGPTGLAVPAATGRIANALLNSKTIRAGALNQPAKKLTESEILQALRIGAPVVSAQ